jgi:hypothetical protein
MARTTVRLHAPPGTDEANFGTTKYRVNNDGTIDVPEAAAEALLDRGGFAPDDEPDAPSAGMVPVQHATDPKATVSWGAVTYAPDENGILQVPAEAVADLGPHGFSGVEAKTDEEGHPLTASDDFNPRAAELEG